MLCHPQDTHSSHAWWLPVHCGDLCIAATQVAVQTRLAEKDNHEPETAHIHIRRPFATEDREEIEWGKEKSRMILQSNCIGKVHSFSPETAGIYHNTVAR